MSHSILRREEARCAQALQQPRAIVRAHVERRGARLVVEAGWIAVAKLGTYWAPLPVRTEVVDEAGAPIKPSPGRRFFVSVETFDPCHALFEAEALDGLGYRWSPP